MCLKNSCENVTIGFKFQNILGELVFIYDEYPENRGVKVY